MSACNCSGRAPDGSVLHVRGCAELAKPRATSVPNPGNVLPFVAAQGAVSRDPGALAAAAGAQVVAHPDSVEVNGHNLNLLDALTLLRAQGVGEVRFIVMPVPDRGVVLLTFGHSKSKDQFCFTLSPAFSEQFGQALIQGSRQVRGVNVGTPPGPPA